jgi:hypothetical protein
MTGNINYAESIFKHPKLHHFSHVNASDTNFVAAMTGKRT